MAFIWGQTLIVLTICVVVRFICEKLAARASCQASVDVKQVLRKRIYRKMLSLGASYHEQVSTSEVMQVCTEGVEQLEIYFGKYLPQLFYSLLAPLTLFFCADAHKPSGKCGTFDLCASDSGFYCGSTKACKKTFEPILEYLYRTWRFVSGKSSGNDHS